MEGGTFTTRFVDPYLKFHRYIYERSDGRVGKHSNRVPALLLTTTGRRSGATRTVGLTYCRDRGDYVVVASNGGSDRSPAWLFNVEADPRVTVRVGRTVVGATARVAGRHLLSRHTTLRGHTFWSFFLFLAPDGCECNNCHNNRYFLLHRYPPIENF